MHMIKRIFPSDPLIWFHGPESLSRANSYWTSQYIHNSGADKSLARPTSRCIFLMVRIFLLILVLLYL